MSPFVHELRSEASPRRRIGCLTYRRLLFALVIFITGAVLSACSRSPETTSVLEDNQEVPEAAQAQQTAAGTVQNPQASAPELSTQVDRQGAVEVAVTPLDLSDDGSGELHFLIAMNTHSVDLSMDLSQLSTLETDLGASLPAESWTGGSGHHVQGTLSFPALTPDGSSAIQGASEITLRIRSVDAPERVFTWSLAPR